MLLKKFSLFITSLKYLPRIRFVKILTIIIIVVFISDSAFSQCNCNINLGDSENSESYWSQSGIGGNGYIVDKWICVKGRLYMDVDIKFVNCHFKMYKNSEIYVTNDTKFNSSHCSYEVCENSMWNGIIGTWGSILEFNANTINDAKIGLYCHPNATIKLMIQNKFNRCRIGIEAQSALTLSPFVGNSFFSNGTMKDPFIGDYPAIGMNLIEMGTVTEKKGRYNHMHVGIKLNGTTYVGDRINIQQGGSLDLSRPPFIFITSFGIAAGNSSDLTLRNSRIREYPAGVFASQTSINLEQDTISNIVSAIIVVENRKRNVLINDNIIDTVSNNGIVVKNSAPTLMTLIENNRIDFRSFSIYGILNEPCWGISIDNDFLLDIENNMEISENYIFQNDKPTDNFFSFFFANTGNFTVNHNTALFDLPSLKPKYGIYTVSSPAINYNSNIMTGGGLNTPNATGYYIRNADFNNFCCNTATATDIGIEFNGNCIASQLRGSILTGPFRTNALLFSFTWTAIQQEYPGNDWNGQSQADAKYIGDDFIATNDNFIVSTPGLPFHPDDPIDGPIDWFVRPMNPNPEYSCLQDPNCDGMPGINCNDFPNDQFLLVDGYSGLHGEGITWQARKNVLRKMWIDPEFGCNTAMVNNFKSSHTTSNLGILAQITNDVNSILSLADEDRIFLNNLLSTINSEIQSITQIDEIWDDENADFDYWIQQRKEHIELLNQAIEQSNSIRSVHQENYLAAIPTIQVELNSLNPTNNMEENDIFVTGIYLDKLLDPEFTFTSNQLAILNTIANQCPLDGGDGVSRARSLLRKDNQILPYPGASCEGLIGQRSKINSQYNFDILPNPSNGNFVIRFASLTSDQYYTLRLFSLDGKCINTFKSNKPVFNFDPDIQAGSYIIKVIFDDGSELCKKLIIQP
jgi:hypothetical protein